MYDFIKIFKLYQSYYFVPYLFKLICYYIPTELFSHHSLATLTTVYLLMYLKSDDEINNNEKI